MPLLAR